jgi:hypothetical protein
VPSRLLRPALAAAVLLTTALPSVAWAAEAALREPADAVVTGATRLVIRVATASGERVERIDATLRHLDGEIAPDARHLLCEDAETCSRDRADYTIEFDPRTGAPFLPAGSAQILANGDYVVRVVVTRTDDAAAQTIDLPMTLSAPGTAAADLRATAEDGEVLLAWEPAPEPDVAGYLVERATDTGWTLVAEVPAEAASLFDAPGTGMHAYRVVTLRPDGRGATYETVSRETSVEVTAASDSPVTADGSGDEAAVPPPAPPTDGSQAATPTGPDDPPADSSSEAPASNGTGSPDVSPTPSPDASASTRTVTEDGELVLEAAEAAPGTAGTQPARPVIPILLGLVLVGLAVRVRRRGRSVHRRSA